MNDEQEAAVIHFATSIAAVCLLLAILWILTPLNPASTTGYTIETIEIPLASGAGGLLLSVVFGVVGGLSAAMTIFILPPSIFGLVEAFTTVEIRAKSVFIILSTIGLLTLLSFTPLTTTFISATILLILLWSITSAYVHSNQLTPLRQHHPS